MKCEISPVYSNPRCSSICGVKLATGLSTFIKERVKVRYLDLEGEKELNDSFENLASTDFETSILREIFHSDEIPRIWKVGEALAECYLEDHKCAKFHYNSNRDAKNPKSNLTGADLVGYVEINGETIFLFGEVKTSADANYPPSVVYGRSGLRIQLTDIRTRYRLRDSLIKWLSFKAQDKDGDFRKDHDSALKKYIGSGRKKFKLVGLLVRDVKPDSRDLDNLVNAAGKIDDPNYVELIAIYVPMKFEKILKLMEN